MKLNKKLEKYSTINQTDKNKTILWIYEENFNSLKNTLTPKEYEALTNEEQNNPIKELNDFFKSIISKNDKEEQKKQDKNKENFDKLEKEIKNEEEKI